VPDVGRDTLVLFPGALGDAVCLEPAVAWLAGEGTVTVQARGAALEVAALFPARPALRSLDAPEVARLFAPPRGATRRAPAERDGDPAADSEVARWLAGYGRVVSFTGAAVPHVAARLQEAGAVAAPFPRPPLPAHASTLLWRAVGAPDVPTPCPRLELALEIGRPPRPTLVLLPGAGAPAKRAPLEVFATLAERWRALPGEVDVVLGPAEEGEAARWRALGRVTRPGSVVELASRLAGASAFAGNDSGPSHVAASLSLPGVVLYASTCPAAFGPRGPRIAALHVAGATPDAVWHAMCGVLP